MAKRSLAFCVIVLSTVLNGCEPSFNPPTVEQVDNQYLKDYTNTLDQWRAQRVERLKGESGWLNVVGLFWLTPGENRFGSAAGNTIRYDHAPEFIGTFIWQDQLRFAPAQGVSITNENNEPITTATTAITVSTDADDQATQLKAGNLHWYVIKRGNKLGVRLRDFQAKALKDFSQIDYFNQDVSWVKVVQFEPFDAAETIAVPTVIDQPWMATALGTLRFDIHGKTYRLKALDSGDRFFMIFGDATNGDSTYAAGRFLYVDKPKDGGVFTLMDFNKAYNPPCVFTDYATCPLPPPGNRLEVAIGAGEKMYGQNKH